MPKTAAPTQAPQGAQAPAAVVPIKLSASDDQLFEAGDYIEYFSRLEHHTAQCAAVRFEKLDSAMTEAWIAELYFLQQRLIGLGNKISGDTELEKRLHLTLQTVCDLQTTAFNRACEILDADQTEPLGSWVVYKNTMKKKGHHPAQMAHDYFIAQAKKFIAAGGEMSDIVPVSSASLAAMPDGAIYEYVVDEYNTARMARCDREPTPGHTLLAMGNDALAAGTMKKFGEYFIVGTMSGHFRTPVETIKHMVKHLRAAGVPQHRIVVQEGEAASPRAIEIVHRAEKRFGDGTKALVKTLQEEARRFNPNALYDSAPAAEKPKFVDHVANLPPAARELPTARVRMQNVMREALADGFILSYDGEVARVLSAVEYVLVASECAGDNRAYAEAMAVLKHLSSLPEHFSDLVARKALVETFAKWSKHVFGSGAMTPAEIFSPPSPDLRRMRIVATIDPRADEATLRKMILAGMDVARLNAAHGDHSELIAAITRLRSVAKDLGRDVRVQVDLSGPKIRLGKFENPTGAKFNDIHVYEGQKVTLTTKDVLGTAALLPVDYPTLADDLKVGDPIYLNDGNVKLTATDVRRDAEGHAVVEAVVETEGKFWDRKGINLPMSRLSVPTVGEDDRAALEALLPHVDLVAMSFVRSPADVLEVRGLMQKHGKVVPVIAKIERREALEDLGRIAATADALMVARGDLGVEIGEAFVGKAEKKIIEAAKMTGKPVMVATEAMMTLLQNSARASRGEVQGLYSAIESGADAVMLGKETSASPSPGDVIGTVADLVRGIEHSLNDEAYEEMLEAEAEEPSAGMSLTALRVAQAQTGRSEK